MSRVLFAGGGTGGHVYPALALAAALKQERPGTQVHFVGAKRGVEAHVLPAEQQPHTLLPFEPLRRDRIWQNWRLIPSLFNSVRGLRRLFGDFRPQLVVGTGGYASAPACLFAVARGIPVAVQEQNSHAGLTTRTLSRWARQVHLGFPEARRFMKPGKRTEITTLGNPIRPPDANIDRAAARARFGLSTSGIVVLVVGGSQGSRAINEALLAAVQQANAHPGFELLWVTGPNHIESINERLPEHARAWVKTIGYINDMPQALAASDVAVSRAGAMATAELLAWGVPMLLIPLPTAAADHQTHNARALADAGAAVMLVESELNAERLWQELLRITGDADTRARMAQAARERARPNAAREIARKLTELLEAS